VTASCEVEDEDIEHSEESEARDLKKRHLKKRMFGVGA
jgi:hypothetical protein